MNPKPKPEKRSVKAKAKPRPKAAKAETITVDNVVSDGGVLGGEAGEILPKFTVPKVGPARTAKLPAVAERTLDNGLRVLAVRKPGIPMVQARLSLPTARPKPTDADRARQRVLAGTLLAGTAQRSSVDLAEALQRIGGALEASLDSEALRLRGSALSTGLGDLLGLVGEVLAEASFPRDEVEIERARKQQEVLLQRADPAVLARIALLRRVYGEHAYAEALPDPADFGRVTAAELKRYMNTRVGPAGGVLVLVGDLRPEKALDATEAALGGWAGSKPGGLLPATPPIEPGPLVLTERPGAAQSNIRLAGPALRRTDPGLPALQLASMVFGGYFSSRLVENIRERKGYTYSPRSGIEHEQVASIFTVTADVGTEVTAPALLEIRYELGRMATLPVEVDELEAAKRYLVGSTALSTQTQSGLANYLFALTLGGLGFDYLRDLPKRLESVTVGEVRDAAARYLAPNKLVTVVLGDATVVRAPLETLVDVAEGPQP